MRGTLLILVSLTLLFSLGCSSKKEQCDALNNLAKATLKSPEVMSCLEKGGVDTDGIKTNAETYGDDGYCGGQKESLCSTLSAHMATPNCEAHKEAIEALLKEGGCK